MESKSQNPQSSTESSNQAKSPQASETAGKSSQTSGQTPRASQGETTNNGQERVSGLDDVSSREPLSRTRGEIEQLGNLNSQTGTAGKARAALSSQDTPVQPRQSTSRRSSSDETPQWQTTLQQGWTAVASRVKAATPAQLAIGAAAVGAAVWLSTRKRTSKQPSSQQQSAADRWLDYPTGNDYSRNDGHYGQYGRSDSQYGSQASGQSGSKYGGQSGSRSQYGDQYGSRYGSSSSQQNQYSSGTTNQGQSQTTNGPASGPYGQSGETWQRPSEERWDD